MPLGEQQAQHTAGQVCPGHPVLLRAWPKSLPSKIPLLGMAEARPQSGVSLFPQLFPRPMCRPSFRSSWGFQIPLCKHKEQVSPPACPQQPTSPPALSFSPSPGVGRAAGQGGGGVGRAVRVGPRPPPADEVRGAEPLHPLGQVRAPQEAPRSWLPPLGALVGAGSSEPLLLAWGAMVPAAGRPVHTAGSPLQVPLRGGHGAVVAPRAAALLLPAPPRVQPPLPLQVQRLRLQPLHPGESPPEPPARTEWGGVWISAGGDGAPAGAHSGPCTRVSASSSSGMRSRLLSGSNHKACSRSFFPCFALTFSLLPP